MHLVEVIAAGARRATPSIEISIGAGLPADADGIVPEASEEIEEIRWISLKGGLSALPLAPLLVERVIPALRSR